MDRARLSAAQIALYCGGMPAIPPEIEGLPNRSGEFDAMTEDGQLIDLKTRYRDVFDIVSDEPRKGTPPVGKMTKAEKKLAKKQRIKGRLLIQEARKRVQQFFDDTGTHGLSVERAYIDEHGMPQSERVDPKDVLK